MQFGDTLRFASGSVRSHRLRSGLTMLGIAVGIGAVVLLTAVGEGVRQFVLAEFTQFGTNIVAITPGKTSTFGVSGATISSVRHLTVDDAEALHRINEVEAVVPVIQGNARVEFGQRNRRTTIIGVGADMPQVWSMGVSVGQFLPDDAFASARAFAVLGSRMRDELFGTSNPLGQRIRVGSDRFRVVGVMESKGQMLGFDLDDTVFIPIGKATEVFNREGLMEIDVTYHKDDSAEAVVAALRRLLLARHGQEDFTIKTQQQMLEVLDSILQLLTLGVAAIGAISLIVGAVGITTIMTIAVAERTSEVGLFRAIGAPRSEIRKLFLLESAILGGVGGIAGIVGAVALVQSVRFVLPDFPLNLVWHYSAVAFAVATMIGIVSGLAPAAKAARMDPVEALRAE
ncbi:MAG: ABC transporter permease [Gammaproteobacteria bacterium]|jgi:putative ABC transport system permease protein